MTMLNFLPAEWTAIATRPRTARPSSALLTWSHLPEAEISVERARELAAAGVLLMASRHTANRVELVIRRSGTRPVGA